MNWQARAVCRNEHPELMFPHDRDEAGIARAKAVCVACPVRQQCLDDAITGGQDHGIWGGMTPAERRTIKRRRRHYATVTGG